MHFTVHLRSKDTYQDDYSYGLVFIPCPVWTKGAREVLNLNPERPDYCEGSIAKLIKKERLKKKLTEQKEAIILIHPIRVKEPQRSPLDGSEISSISVGCPHGFPLF